MKFTPDHSRVRISAPIDHGLRLGDWYIQDALPRSLVFHSPKGDGSKANWYWEYYPKEDQFMGDPGDLTDDEMDSMVTRAMNYFRAESN